MVLWQSLACINCVTPGTTDGTPFLGSWNPGGAYGKCETPMPEHRVFVVCFLCCSWGFFHAKGKMGRGNSLSGWCGRGVPPVCGRTWQQQQQLVSIRWALSFGGFVLRFRHTFGGRAEESVYKELCIWVRSSLLHMP